MGKIIHRPSAASQRRIEANRKNAQASTGPRTPQGKEASSQNAVAHGLTARNILLAGEDSADFLRLRAEAFAELQPRGVLERELTDQIVDTLWRSRRVPLFEKALVASLGYVAKKEAFMLDGIGAGLDGSETPKRAREIRLGRVIERFLSGDFVGKLSRYETNLQRQLSRLLKELKTLKRQTEIEIDMKAAPFGSETSGDRCAR